MKTTSSALGNAVQAGTLDEIVFENRNHEYGAYYLRKNYSRYLFLALLFIALLFGSTTYAWFWRYMHTPKIVEVIPQPRIVPPVDFTDVPKIDIPKPPDPITQSSVESQTYGPPVIVDNITTNEPNPQPVVDIPEVTNPPIVLVPTNTTPEIDNIDNNVGYHFVQVQALYNGGDVGSFNKWVQENVTFPEEAIRNDVSGTVYIDFAVNKYGDICDIKIIKSPHQSLSDEVIRVMNKSLKWIPASQNGNACKQLFSMQVKFKINP